MATRLVPYSHAAHHAQIRHICKDVYGGTDYLPAEILGYSQDNRKVVRVLETVERRDVLGVGELSAAAACGTGRMWGRRLRMLCHCLYHGCGSFRLLATA